MKDKFVSHLVTVYIIMFVFQLLQGGYAVYNMYPTYPDLSFWHFAALVFFGALVIGTALTLIYAMLIMLIAYVINWINQ